MARHAFPGLVQVTNEPGVRYCNANPGGEFSPGKQLPTAAYANFGRALMCERNGEDELAAEYLDSAIVAEAAVNA